MLSFLHTWNRCGCMCVYVGVCAFPILEEEDSDNNTDDLKDEFKKLRKSQDFPQNENDKDCVWKKMRKRRTKRHVQEDAKITRTNTTAGRRSRTRSHSRRRRSVSHRRRRSISRHSNHSVRTRGATPTTYRMKSRSREPPSERRSRSSRKGREELAASVGSARRSKRGRSLDAMSMSAGRSGLVNHTPYAFPEHAAHSYLF